MRTALQTMKAPLNLDKVSDFLFWFLVFVDTFFFLKVKGPISYNFEIRPSLSQENAFRLSSELDS